MERRDLIGLFHYAPSSTQRIVRRCYKIIDADIIDLVDTRTFSLSGNAQCFAAEDCFLLHPKGPLASEVVTHSIYFYGVLTIPCQLLPFVGIVALGAHEDSQPWYGAQERIIVDRQGLSSCPLCIICPVYRDRPSLAETAQFLPQQKHIAVQVQQPP